MHSIQRRLAHVLPVAVAAASLITAAPGWAASLEVNGKADSADVSAPLPAQIAWDVSDVTLSNGIFLFVSQDRQSLQAQQGTCATAGDEAFQNPPGGLGFQDGRASSHKHRLARGTWYVLGCAARRQDDGNIANRHGPTNIVAVQVTDSRPSAGGDQPVATLPDLVPIAVGVVYKRKANDPDFHIAGYGVELKWPGHFDPSGLSDCDEVKVLVFNAGGSRSGATDVRILVDLEGESAKARGTTTRVPSLRPGECYEASMKLTGRPHCSNPSAQVDRKGAVTESDEGNNAIPPAPATKASCRLKTPRTTVDHRGGQDKKTVDHR